MNFVETGFDRREELRVQNARQTAAILMQHSKEQVEAERTKRLFITDRLVHWMRGMRR